MEHSTKAYMATLPPKPMCANDFANGVKRWPVLLALTVKHIQLNKPWELSFLAFDIDRWGAMSAAEEAELPTPTFTMVNPQNGHAHTLYQLNTPVLVGRRANPAPFLFYKDIDAAYTLQLQADPAFNKVLIKTPGHPDWHTTHTGVKYELTELRDYIRVNMAEAKKLKRSATEGIVAYSRTISLFNLLRKWAYRNVELYKQQDDFSAFFADAAEKASTYCTHEIMAAIPTRPTLPVNEQISIVTSVTSWSWTNYNATCILTSDLSDIQRQRVLKRWGDNTQKRLQAKSLKESGHSYSMIAEEIDVSRRTVIRWLT